MNTTTVQGRAGEQMQVPIDALDALRSGLTGEVLTPEHPEYDEARAIWNAMIDRRPALVVSCANAEDVQQAVRFARDYDLLVTVRGGGHNIAGNAVADGAMMIDLSQMRDVRVDAEARRAHVEAGCLLSDVDAATQAHGLAVPLGINSTTGVAGLTLGGGFGWLSRKHGMAIDHLISAEVVTADGQRITASADEHPDLFWALRGGGGNFGVVTSFEFGLEQVGPDVLAGLIVHPLDHARQVLRAYRDYAESAPDEVSVWVVMRKAPPLPFLPEEWHGREVVVLAAFHAGNPEEGERLLAPLRAIGAPIGEHVDVMPYAGWQQAFDPLLTPGARNYWKSHDFDQLDDGLLDMLIGYVRKLPTPECEVFIGQVGGAASRIPTTATAYPHREARYIMNVHTRWSDAGMDDACITWARDLFLDTAPYATGGVYVNFLTADEADRVRAAYGDNYLRLSDVKRRYDPDNLFRMNQNIMPAVEA